MNKLPIIIDTDPGIDDALALLLLYKHKSMFDIRLICSTAGNNPIEVTTNNVKYFAKNVILALFRVLESLRVLIFLAFSAIM